MVANHDNMLDTFNLCNMEYFEGKLLFPQFALLHSFRTCGYFQYTKGGWLDKTLYDPTISMTDYYDFTEKQFRDIMCHEMIHYYLAYFGIDRNCKHGNKFKEMAEQLNVKYGLNITPTLDIPQYKPAESTTSDSNQNDNNMRFFKEYDGVIYEFKNFNEWFWFKMGRLCAIPLLILVLDLFLTIICLFGYGDTPFPILRVIWFIVKLFVEFFIEL